MLALLRASVELLPAMQSREHGALLSPGSLWAVRLWWREQALAEQGPPVPELPSWTPA